MMAHSRRAKLDTPMNVPAIKLLRGWEMRMDTSHCTSLRPGFRWRGVIELLQAYTMELETATAQPLYPTPLDLL
jgi:hypothetical protein